METIAMITCLMNMLLSILLPVDSLTKWSAVLGWLVATLCLLMISGN